MRNGGPKSAGQKEKKSMFDNDEELLNSFAEPLPNPIGSDGAYFQIEGALTTAQAALRFMLAGNAYFTLRSKRTGTRYTYRVNQAKDDAQQTMFLPNALRPPRYFVALLSGPDNTADYTYLGMIEGTAVRPTFRLTRASRMTSESLPVKAISYTVAHLAQGTVPEQLEIWHEGRCGRCGRMLTVPESVAAGIGPECAERMGL
jgi:Family of unknown function (DUF6011)